MSSILSYKKVRKFHHTAELDIKCTGCGRPFIQYWEDAEEKNGRSETMYGFEGREKCRECKTKELGHPPKTLQEINEELKRAIESSTGSGSS